MVCQEDGKMSGRWQEDGKTSAKYLTSISQEDLKMAGGSHLTSPSWYRVAFVIVVMW